MDPTEEVLKQIASDVWETVLSRSLEDLPDPGPEGQGITGCINISGAWEGVVQVYCEGELGRHLASAMFEMEPDEVSIAEITDAVAEIANILGGNIKALLPQPSFLSLPSTVVGRRCDIHYPRTQVAAELTLRCEGERVGLHVLKGSPDGEPSAAS